MDNDYTSARENLLKYLTHDSDAVERILLNDVLTSGCTVTKSMRQKNWRCVTADQMGKTLRILAAFDEDGETYEEIEMAVTMAFTKNGKRYYSNGVFAIETSAVVIEQAEITSFFARMNEGNDCGYSA